MEPYKSLYSEKKWSGKVKTKWKAPEGTFTGSATEIADKVAAAHTTLKSALGSLSFYANRSGSNLSDKQAKAIEKAKDLVRKKFEKE